MTGPFLPVAMLNLIRGVLGIHHHRFNLSVKRSRDRYLKGGDAPAAPSPAKPLGAAGDRARSLTKEGKRPKSRILSATALKLVENR
jgi:hypothetical protein